MKIFVGEKKEKMMDTNHDPMVKKYIIDHMITRGIITTSKNLKDADDSINFMKQIIFSHIDAFDLIEKFRRDKNAFIFVDPPYLFSNNESYLPQVTDTDATDYYVKFLDILKDKTTKAKIMLVINDLKLLRWMYGGYIKKIYGKTYSTSKKKARHLVITNY